MCVCTSNKFAYYWNYKHFNSVQSYTKTRKYKCRMFYFDEFTLSQFTGLKTHFHNSEVLYKGQKKAVFVITNSIMHQSFIITNAIFLQTFSQQTRTKLFLFLFSRYSSYAFAFFARSLPNVCFMMFLYLSAEVVTRQK